jgi:hypothetical protein
LTLTYEFYNEKIINALVDAGADMKARDVGGKIPQQMPRAPPMVWAVGNQQILYGCADVSAYIPGV